MHPLQRFTRHRDHECALIPNVNLKVHPCGRPAGSVAVHHAPMHGPMAGAAIGEKLRPETVPNSHRAPLPGRDNRPVPERMTFYVMGWLHWAVKRFVQLAGSLSLGDESKANGMAVAGRPHRVNDRRASIHLLAQRLQHLSHHRGTRNLPSSDGLGLSNDVQVNQVPSQMRAS